MGGTNLHRDVREFHEKFGHPVRTTPRVPTEEEMRFRLKLIAEEFVELLLAAGYEPNTLRCPKTGNEIFVGDLNEALRHAIEQGPSLEMDLPAFVDAQGDLDYVNEGTRAVIGYNGAPIHNAIHYANMQKDPVYVAAKDDHHRTPDPKAKPTKPEGWSPPDIEQELIEQGWVRG